MAKQKVKSKRPRTSSKKAPVASTERMPLTVNAKERDNMLDALQESDNADIKEVATQYAEGDDAKRLRFRTHYERMGNELIQAIFHGDRKRVIELASIRDQKLL